MLVDTGRQEVLRVLAGIDAVETYDMLLFTNNYTVIETTVLGDLTEVAVAGYARQLLGSFTSPVGPVAGIWTTIAANVNFGNASGGAVTCYGWAYVGSISGILYGGGNFPVPLTLPAGGSLTLSPGWSSSTL